jgi:ATP-dependent exoDNAse (exonuclease V) beta subunit
MSADDAYYAENVLFPEDEGDENGAETKEANSVANLAEVGKEAGVKHEKKSGGKSGKSSLYGTAYHRFLQLCDFAIKDRKGIAREVEEFVGSGLMPTEQAELLSIDNLVDILAMKAFDNLSGATLYREREFLCTLPASSFLNTTADDGVLFQGAIDLLAIGSFGTAIIDYKYSTKTDEELIEKYSAQLALYKKAVSAILKIDEKNISTTIINIRKKREIPLK